MTHLAIRGHATRGGEVIEILHMLGGENKNKLSGDMDGYVYIINHSYEGEIDCLYAVSNMYRVFTIEEFFEKYPYKVGDKVQAWVNGYYDVFNIQDMIWDGIVSEVKYKIYKYYYSADNIQPYKEELIVPKFKVGDKVKSKHNKYTYEIAQVSDTHYTIVDIECKCKYTEPISEDENWELVKEEIMEEKRIPPYMDYNVRTEETIGGKLISREEMSLKINTSQMEKRQIIFSVDSPDETELVLGNNYEIKVEDGKTYVVRKKPQYPKTYEECFNICFGNKHHIVQVVGLDGLGDNKELFENLIKLKICRDAYWKIAGEQLELDKSWEPDWTNTNSNKYCIYYVGDEIKKQPMLEVHHFLAFPTAEMRDAFFENFKDLIEQCKELL